MTFREKFVVIGFIKCGQVSLNTWVNSKYPGSSQRNELIYKQNSAQEYERCFGINGKFGHFTPLIITRDPIERIWSAFRYFRPRTTFAEWCLHSKIEPFGQSNPIVGSNYARWIKPLLQYNPLIVNIEFMRKLPDFPKDNVTPNYYDINENDLALAKDLFQMELNGEFWNEALHIPSDKAVQHATRNL